MTDETATRENLSKQGAQINLGGCKYNYKISTIKEDPRKGVIREDPIGVFCVPATVTGACPTAVEV